MGRGDKMTLAVYIPLLSGAPVTRGTCINSVLYRAMAKLQRAGTPALEIRYALIESIASRNGSMCRSSHWSFLGNAQIKSVEIRSSGQHGRRRQPRRWPRKSNKGVLSLAVSLPSGASDRNDPVLVPLTRPGRSVRTHLDLRKVRSMIDQVIHTSFR